MPNNISEGSCVSQGGTASYKKKMKYLYIRTTKCPNRHKNLDYWYLLNKYSPKTQNFNVFFTLWMKSIIKMQKLNNWPKWFSAMGKKKALSLKILLCPSYSLSVHPFSAFSSYMHRLFSWKLKFDLHFVSIMHFFQKSII